MSRKSDLNMTEKHFIYCACYLRDGLNTYKVLYKFYNISRKNFTVLIQVSVLLWRDRVSLYFIEFYLITISSFKKWDANFSSKSSVRLNSFILRISRVSAKFRNSDLNAKFVWIAVWDPYFHCLEFVKAVNSALSYYPTGLYIGLRKRHWRATRDASGSVDVRLSASTARRLLLEL